MVQVNILIEFVASEVFVCCVAVLCVCVCMYEGALLKRNLLAHITKSMSVWLWEWPHPEL